MIPLYKMCPVCKYLVCVYIVGGRERGKEPFIVCVIMKLLSRAARENHFVSLLNREYGL